MIQWELPSVELLISYFVIFTYFNDFSR